MEENPLERHVANLVGRLTPCADRIRALANECSVSFACLIYTDSEKAYNQDVYFLVSDRESSR